MVDKDVTIPQLVLQIDLLRSHVFSLQQTNDQLQQEIRRLHEENQRLQDQIARLKRNSSNSSKPPSSDIVKPQKKGTSRRKGKRKIGGQQGHPRQERIPFGPDDIDATRFHVLPAEQVQDLIPRDDWFILQQVELVKKLYRVTEHRARKRISPTSSASGAGRPRRAAPECNRERPGRHPLLNMPLTEPAFGRPNTGQQINQTERFMSGIGLRSRYYH